MSQSGPRFALHAAAHSARSFDALSAGLSDPVGAHSLIYHAASSQGVDEDEVIVRFVEGIRTSAHPREYVTLPPGIDLTEMIGTSPSDTRWGEGDFHFMLAEILGYQQTDLSFVW
jgi:hypothetical protein